MYKVKILPLAKQEVKEAANWYNKKEKGLGKLFTKQLRKKLASIKQNPKKYQNRYDNTRNAIVEVFPYMIHFNINDKTIIISAVYHTSRDSKVWNHRK